MSGDMEYMYKQLSILLWSNTTSSYVIGQQDLIPRPRGRGMELGLAVGV